MTDDDHPPTLFWHPIRVRFHEVDTQNVVYNARYLEYVDVAMTEYFRMLTGVSYGALVKRGFDPTVRHASLDFERPARLDDVIHVGVRTQHIGRTSLRLEYELRRDAALVARAQLTYVNIDATAMSSSEVPEDIRTAVEEYEGLTAGEPRKS
jgi:acyl-CoA thioester hydrolase